MTKPKVLIDFETESEVDLVKCGTTKYLAGKDADIVCCGVRYEDEDSTRLWVPGDNLLEVFKHPEEYSLYAYNAQFDMRVWNILGAKYYFGRTKIEDWVDVMAICGRFTYPQSLGKVGEVLNLPVQKQKRGKQLIKKICVPPYEYSYQDLMEFHSYCKDDVNSMWELLNALPASQLSLEEQKVWELTCKINFTGLPIDMPAVKQIIRVTDAYKLDQNELLPDLTGGLITKATQTKRITQWIRAKGITIPNLQADTVEKMLDRLDLPEEVQTVLELRQEIGLSSTAKYKKLEDQYIDGRIYDNLRYYKANTGRWGGQGFQMHNLPRSKVKDADPIIAKFHDLSIIEDNPVKAAKSIVRGMIKAPEGKMLAAADYTGIENRGLAWIAEDEETLQLFRDGLDQYIEMATHIFGKPYDQITDEERQFGKVLILGCGYGLGWRGFIKTADGWGIYVTPERSQELVGTYRHRYKLVVQLWYACKSAAINAINSPGIPFRVKKVLFTCVKDRNNTRWLQLTLPSGRNLYYNNPLVEDGPYGAGVTAMGINPYTKKWMRLKVIPGRFVENIVQALSRDILVAGKLNLDEAGYKIIGSIHDEVLLELSTVDLGPHLYGTVLSHIYKLMCDAPTWADGLPLAAEGMIEKRYRKM